MNEFFKSVVGKCFLYIMFYIFIFILLTFISMFLVNDFNVLEWALISKLMLLFFSFAFTFFVSLAEQH